MTREPFGQAEQEPRRRAGQGALALALLATAGCLVTERVDFDTPNNSPPIVRGVSPNYWFALGSVGDARCDPADSVAFVAEISDNDVEDTLDAIIVVNGVQKPSANQKIPVDSARSVTRAEVTLCVERSAFTEPCNLVELLVSHKFSVVGQPYAVDTPGDLGRERWIVHGSFNPGSSDTKPSDCASLFGDAGMP